MSGSTSSAAILSAEQSAIRNLTANPGKNPPPPYFPATDVDARDIRTPDRWIPRLSRDAPNVTLTRLTGNHPFNAEPQLPDLMRDGLITSSFKHYVRNHGAVPRLEWNTHKIELLGIGMDGVKIVTMDEIASLESIEIPVTMCCDGNRRAEINRVRRSQGFDWSAGAVGTGERVRRRGQRA